MNSGDTPYQWWKDLTLSGLEDCGEVKFEKKWGNALLSLPHMAIEILYSKRYEDQSSWIRVFWNITSNNNTLQNFLLLDVILKIISSISFCSDRIFIIKNYNMLYSFFGSINSTILPDPKFAISKFYFIPFYYAENW